MGPKMMKVNIVASRTTLSETLPSAQRLYWRMKYEIDQVKHIKQKTYIGPVAPLRYEAYDYHRRIRVVRIRQEVTQAL